MSYSSSTFAGVDATTLQAWLTEALTAEQALATGGKVVTLNYNMGAGGKSVTYAATDLTLLRRRIQSLQSALGLRRPARAMRAVF